MRGIPKRERMRLGGPRHRAVSGLLGLAILWSATE